MDFAFNDLLSRRITEAIFEQDVFGIAVRVIDPADSCWMKVNQRLCDIFGYSEEEMLELTSVDISLPEERLIATKINEQLLTGEIKSYSGERRYSRKDGSVVWTNLWLSPIFDDNGKPVQILSVTEDITKRKLTVEKLQEAFAYLEVEIQKRTQEALESRNRLQAIFDHAPVELFLKDRDGRYVAVNRQYEELFDVRNEDVVGKLPEDLHGAELGESARENDLAVLRTGEVQTEVQKANTVIGVRLLHTIKFPVYDLEGEVSGIGAIASDITELKNAEAQMAIAKEEAEAANLAKSEFLSSMSHELRTPLNAILGFSQLLKDNPDEPLSEDQQEAVEHITKGGEHLLTLINEVLDLSRIEAGEMDLNMEPLHPGFIFRESLEFVRSMAASKNVSLNEKDGTPYKVNVDYTRLKQTILNLLSNAVKYNVDGGKVTFGCVDRPGGIVRIYVTDTGRGIPEDRKSGLFTAFNRLGMEASDIEGTGIGLTICQRLVESMGGVIGCHSVEGQGSTFWVDFPRAEENPEGVSALQLYESFDIESDSEVIEKSQISGTVLYIEDNQANLALMKAIIGKSSGLDLIFAHSAELGLEKARRDRPDLVIMDINLPGMSGLEAISCLQRMEETRGIPVIALSAAATQKDIANGLNAGFVHYLTKPVNVREVKEMIKSFLDKAH